MDFGSPFALQCLLAIITVTHGSATRIGVLSGGSAVFALGNQSLQNLSRMSKGDGVCSTTVLNDALLAKCGNSACRCLNWLNGSLELKRVEKEDEGKYEFVFPNATSYFALEVFEPTIGIQCFPNGTAELSCNATSAESMTFRWQLSGKELSAPGACVKDGGRKVRLDKTVPGEFVCVVSHRSSVTRTRPVALSCSYGDLLQYPWFIYILAGCAVGVLILVVVVPSAICCCMKRKHKFIPVPSDAAQTGPGVEPQPLAEENLQVQIEAEELPDPEVIVDAESQEDASDCFPDVNDD